MKTLSLSLLLSTLLASCYIKPFAPTDYSVKKYAEKYANQLEPGSTLINSRYHYTVEKTPDANTSKKHISPTLDR